MNDSDLFGKKFWLTACTSAALSGVVGAVVDWLLVASQYSQRGDVQPVLPPISVCALVLGLVVGASTTLVAGRNSSPSRLQKFGIALIATACALIAVFAIGAVANSADITWTLIWAGPIAFVVIPLTTLTAMLVRRKTQIILLLFTLFATVLTVAGMYILAA